MLSCLLGLRQPKLDAETRAFFRDARPWGFILFREACVSREQVRRFALTFATTVDHDRDYLDRSRGRACRPLEGA